MPRQQSKTLDALMRLQGVASPNEIAKLARLPLNVVTAQLGRLKEGRFVAGEGEGKGRPATYRISDPMFRTWYQMRYLRPAGRRVELFVEFIRAWFSVEERRKFLQEKWQEFGVGRRLGIEAALMIQHYAAAMEDKQEQLGHIQHLVEVMVQEGKEGEAAMLLAESEEPGELTEKSFESAGYRLLGYWKLAKEDLNGAIVAFREALQKEPGNTRARLGLGVCLHKAGEHALAVKELGRVIKSKGVPSGQAAQALIGRGAAMAQLGDLQGAIADFNAVVESAGAPVAQLSVAFLGRGHAKGQLGDAQGEIADYTAAVELAGAPVGPVSMALFNRGMTKGQLGDAKGEIADYTAVVELAGAPVDQVARALLVRGASKGQLGDAQGAIADYAAVVELVGASVEQVARALVGRGFMKGQIEDPQGALADCTAVVELSGAPTEQVAWALFGRGIAKGLLSDLPGSIAESRAVVELAGAPAEPVAGALLLGGLTLRELGRTEEAISSFQRSVEMKASAESVHESFAALVSALLANKRDAEAAGWMARLHEFETPDVPLEARLEARIQVITEAGTEHGPDAAEALLDAALRSGPEDTRARLEFLRPAIQYAKSGDDLAMSRLPERERDAAKQIAGSIMKKDGGAAKK
jgi:tetratricopeptide (TPR) repeat protein